MIRKVVSYCAKLIKGPGYELDPDLPISAVGSFGFRRLLAAMRCIFYGVKFSFNPRKLVFIGPRVRLRNRRNITFGGGVTLGEGVVIDGLSRTGVHLADRVNIGPYSIIEGTGVISNIGHGCCIGQDSGIGAFSFIGAAGGVRIGNNVIMGQRVSFHSENHRFDRLDVPIMAQGVTREGIEVEDDCWIGANVVFIDGAHLGTGCVVAAGAVVRGIFPAFSIVGGVPAKIIRSRSTAADWQSE
jgi:acetyltransferase-like isoleucine patch superfamily enzyme